LAAEPVGHIRLTDGAANQPGELSKHAVTTIMTMEIIDLLEEVDIKQSNAQRMPVALRPQDFPHQIVLIGAAVVQPGQGVATAQLSITLGAAAQSFVSQLSLSDRDRCPPIEPDHGERNSAQHQ